MQSAKLSPPPPGALGADSLGLPVEEPPPGKVGVVPTALGTVLVTPPGVVTVVSPLPRNVEVVGGDSGATGATLGAGAVSADGGPAPGRVVDGVWSRDGDVDGVGSRDGDVDGVGSREGDVESAPPARPSAGGAVLKPPLTPLLTPPLRPPLAVPPPAVPPPAVPPPPVPPPPVPWLAASWGTGVRRRRPAAAVTTDDAGERRMGHLRSW